MHQVNVQSDSGTAGTMVQLTCQTSVCALNHCSSANQGLNVLLEHRRQRDDNIQVLVAQLLHTQKDSCTHPLKLQSQLHDYSGMFAALFGCALTAAAEAHH